MGGIASFKKLNHRVQIASFPWTGIKNAWVKGANFFPFILVYFLTRVRPTCPSSIRNTANLVAWSFTTLEDWKHFASRSLLTEDHVTTPYQTLCDLPQLGGDYFDNVFRPSGWPSLTLRCPIVPTERMNALIEQLGSLEAADEQIRESNRPTQSPYCCNQSLGCQCVS